MTGRARGVALGLAGILVIAGIALHRVGGGGWVLAVMGLLVALATVFEQRYRRDRLAPAPAPDARWQRTGERELDVETGEALEVWYDPVTGARRYEPMRP
ncbi:hypothetical protein [Novosphingobium sp.]|mgnify:CR=1 FL=1|uniref:hypothetical protein n=1 Tax=Novosphingobium sp. TaxID=1874826 RepID=UPI002FDE7428